MALAKNSDRKGAREPHKLVVTRAHQFKNNNISFDLQIDDWITIYNMLLVALYAKGDKKRTDPTDYFIAFPQHKDDNGNYWNYAYFDIIQPEEDAIEEQIEKLLEENEKEER